MQYSGVLLHLYYKCEAYYMYLSLEAHGCKPWVTNLLIIPHTLGMPTANVTYCIILLEYVNEFQANVCLINSKFFNPSLRALYDSFGCIF